jgi:hypothetical protein
MTEITDWFQNNWIDLARLLVQCAILAAVVRYGRKLLATMRASQEQVGALLKLSVSDTVVEHFTPSSEPSTRRGPSSPEPSRRYEAPSLNLRESEPEPSKRYEAPSLNLREREPEPEPELEPEPVFAGFSRDSRAAEREQSLGGRVIGAEGPVFSAPVARAESPSLTPWVSAPAVAPDMGPDRLSAQTPAIPGRPGVSSWLQSPMRSSGVSPWRKMVRWLQEPARR